MNYKAIFSPQAERQLDRLEQKQRIRVFRKIKSLEESPRPPGCKKLKGFGGIYRIRTGNLRIVYKIEKDVLQILILKIGRRGKDFYDGL